MKTRLYFTVLLFSFLVLGSYGQAAENDFDKVCDYFQALAKDDNVNTMTHLQRNDFILDKIKKNLPTNSNARGAWEAISNAEGSQRYDLYKSSAESVLNTKWQCKPMARLADKTGAF